MILFNICHSDFYVKMLRSLRYCQNIQDIIWCNRLNHSHLQQLKQLEYFDYAPITYAVFWRYFKKSKSYSSNSHSPDCLKSDIMSREIEYLNGIFLNLLLNFTSLGGLKRVMHYFNPSNAKATFVQSTRTQRFLETI